MDAPSLEIALTETDFSSNIIVGGCGDFAATLFTRGGAFFATGFLRGADFFATGFLRGADFFATLFLRAGDFFAVGFLRAGDFFAAFFRLAGDFFAALFLRAGFLAALFFFAGAFLREAFFADFFRPFFAAIGRLRLGYHFPAPTRSPRSLVSLLLNRDSNTLSPAAAAASARSSRLCGTYNR